MIFFIFTQFKRHFNCKLDFILTHGLLRLTSFQILDFSSYLFVIILYYFCFHHLGDHSLNFFLAKVSNILKMGENGILYNSHLPDSSVIQILLYLLYYTLYSYSLGLSILKQMPGILSFQPYSPKNLYVLKYGHYITTGLYLV